MLEIDQMEGKFRNNTAFQGHVYSICKVNLYKDEKYWKNTRPGKQTYSNM